MLKWLSCSWSSLCPTKMDQLTIECYYWYTLPMLAYEPKHHSVESWFFLTVYSSMYTIQSIQLLSYCFHSFHLIPILSSFYLFVQSPIGFLQIKKNNSGFVDSGFVVGSHELVKSTQSFKIGQDWLLPYNLLFMLSCQT